MYFNLEIFAICFGMSPSSPLLPSNITTNTHLSSYDHCLFLFKNHDNHMKLSPHSKQWIAICVLPMSNVDNSLRAPSSVGTVLTNRLFPTFIANIISKQSHNTIYEINNSLSSVNLKLLYLPRDSTDNELS